VFASHFAAALKQNEDIDSAFEVCQLSLSLSHTHTLSFPCAFSLHGFYSLSRFVSFRQEAAALTQAVTTVLAERDPYRYAVQKPFITTNATRRIYYK
jgi:hypothetical protein